MIKKDNIPFFLLIVLVALISAAVGATVATVVVGKRTAKSMVSFQSLLLGKEIMHSDENCFQVYINGPPEIAAWALRNHISFLQRLLIEIPEENKVLATMNVHMNLMLSYSRLSITYERLGKHDLANESLEKAFDQERYFQGIRRPKNEIIEYVKKLDEIMIKRMNNEETSHNMSLHTNGESAVAPPP